MSSRFKQIDLPNGRTEFRPFSFTAGDNLLQPAQIWLPVSRCSRGYIVLKFVPTTDTDLSIIRNFTKLEGVKFALGGQFLKTFNRAT